MNTNVSCSANSLSRCKPLLGTYVEVSLSGDVSDDYLIEQSQKAYKAIELVQTSMSFHDTSSELSSINQTALNREVELSDAMFSVLSYANKFNHDSAGIFDPSIAPALIELGHLPIPTMLSRTQLNSHFGSWRDVELRERSIRFHKPLLLDLGGIAKGFAVDRALACVDPALDIVINAGGDIGMNKWQNEFVGINFGTQASRAVKEVPMQNACIATSASYLNGDQSVIIDPISKRAQQSRYTYSVFAPNCITADALTKVAWLSDMTPDIINSYQASALLIDQHGKAIH